MGAAALELANALLLTYLATELWVRGGGGGGGRGGGGAQLVRRLRLPLGLLVAQNALAGLGSLCAASDTAAGGAVAWLLHLPWRGLQVLGADALLALLVTAAWGLAGLGIVDRRGKLDSKRWRRGLLASLPLVFFLAILLVAATGIDLHLAHLPALAKAIWALAAYTALFFADVRRFCPQLSRLQLALNVARSLLFTLPIFPFVAVMISFAFLVIDSVVENLLSLDPSFLNWPIYYGTLYGPFVFVYFQAKRLCLEQAGTFLP